MSVNYSNEEFDLSVSSESAQSDAEPLSQLTSEARVRQLEKVLTNSALIIMTDLRFYCH